MSSKLIVDTIEDATGTYSLALGSGNSTFPGGIHIGGTGSANLLDDYEEGTWTPAYSFSGGGTVTHGATQTGYYIKIGNLVLATWNLRSTAVSGVSGNLYLSLPFAVKDTAATRPGGSMGFMRNWGADMPNFRIYAEPGASRLNFFYNAANAGTSQVGTSQFGTGSDDNVFEGSIVYVTG